MIDIYACIVKGWRPKRIIAETTWKRTIMMESERRQGGWQDRNAGRTQQMHRTA